MKDRSHIRVVFFLGWILLGVISILANVDSASLNQTKLTDNNVELPLNANFNVPYLCTTDVVSAENGLGNAYHTSLITDKNGNVHCVYSDSSENWGSGTDRDIYYKIWNISLNTWSQPTPLTFESNGDDDFPCIDIDGNGTIHVFWCSFVGNWDWSLGNPNIYHKIWNASTSLWNSSQLIETDGISPNTAIDSEGNLNLVWSRIGLNRIDNDIMLKIWNVTSCNWNIPDIISTVSDNSSYFPSIKIDNEGNKHVTWQDNDDYGSSGDDADIFYRVWDSNLHLWNTTEVISTESVENSYQSPDAMAVDKFDNIHFVWADMIGTDDYEVYYKIKNQTDNTWSTRKLISEACYGDSLHPVIAIDYNENIHIAWEDDTTDYIGQIEHGYDIRYRWFNGTSHDWSQIREISGEDEVNNQYDSLYPEMTVDVNGNLHIAWHDLLNYRGSSNNWDVFSRILIFNNTIPQISHPDDIISDYNANQITWIINDTTVNNPTYEIRIDGSLFYSGIWSPMVEINIAIRTQLGRHNYSIRAFDGIDGYVEDTINVTIQNIKTDFELVSPESDLMSYDPYILADEYGLIHMVWNDKANMAGSGGGCDIIYKQYNPFLNTSKIYVVSSQVSRTYASSFSFCIDNQRTIHFAFASDDPLPFYSGSDHDIYYRNYNIVTGLWSNTEFISNEAGNNAQSGIPDITVDSERNVYIVWEDYSNILGKSTGVGIFYRMKNHITGLWSSTILISTPNFQSTNPHVRVDQHGNVHILYEQSDKILLRTFNKTLGTWGSIYLMNTFTNRSAFANELAIDEAGNLHIIWSDSTDYMGNGNDYDIYYAYVDFTHDMFYGGASVSRVSNMTSVAPRMTIDSSGLVHVVWQEGRRLNNGVLDIEIAHCIINTTTWITTWTCSAMDFITSESIENCDTSSIAVDELGNIHIIYEATIDILGAGSDTDIFYRSIVYTNTQAVITKYGDLTYEYSTLGHEISWLINDRTMYAGTYIILRNGVQIANGNWHSGSRITLNVDYQNIGIWNYTLVVNDGFFTYVQDSITVDVIPPVTALIVVLCIVASSFGIMFYLKKKGLIFSENKLRVFISHQENDYARLKLAEVISKIEEMKEVGYVYCYEKDMKGDLVSWMEKTVPLCQIMIFIATDNSLESKGCAYEISLANKNNVSIIPVLDTNFEWSDLSRLNNREYSFGDKQFKLENVDLHNRYGFKIPVDATKNIDFTTLNESINREIRKFQQELDKVMVEFKKSDIIFISVAEDNIHVSREDIYLAVKYLTQLGKLKGAWNHDKSQFIAKKEVIHRINMIKNAKEYKNNEELILEAKFHEDSIEYILTII